MSDKTVPNGLEPFVVGGEVEFEIIQMWVVDGDQEFEKEFALAKPIIDKEEEYDYWKERCLAAEKFIDLSPCDPDIHGDQWIANNEWNKLKNEE
jgi:hypothetical protein